VRGITHVVPKTTVVECVCPRRVDWEWWMLVTADEHLDSQQCQRALLARHLDQCRDRGGYHIGVGDLYDAMQGPADKRRRLSELKDEHKATAYFDELVNDAVAFFAPYRSMLLSQSYGNHEVSVATNYGTDLTARFVHELQMLGETPIVVAPYQGWIIVRFQYETPTGARAGSGATQIAYHHGTGAGGPVTKGTIQANRRAVLFPDAEIVLSGHIHEAWQMEYVTERIQEDGAVRYSTQWHLQLPTYKTEWDTGNGWWPETGKGPRPLGGWWLRWYWSRDESRVKLAPPVRTEQ